MGRDKRLTATCDGEPVAVPLPPDEAACCTALAGRFRNSQPPFTQAALDAWIADVLALVNPSELA